MSQTATDLSTHGASNEQHDAWDEQVLSRRRFMHITFWAATSISVAAIGLPATQYLAGHAVAKDGGKWVELGALTAFKPDAVNRVTYTVRAKDAWRTIERVGVLYAYSEDGGQSYVVLDGTLASGLRCALESRGEPFCLSLSCRSLYPSRRGDLQPGAACADTDASQNRERHTLGASLGGNHEQ